MEEKKKSNFLNYFYTVILTFILTLIIVLGSLTLYVIKKNPFNVQACIVSSFLSPQNDLTSDSDSDSKLEAGSVVPEHFDHPLLSDTQEAMLDKAGIAVEELPSTISPAMEACFRDSLGDTRVNEIMQGVSPGPLDLFKAKGCL
jgi:hypothetical protein